MTEEVAYICNGANLAKRTLVNPEEASKECVEFTALCERFRIAVHQVYVRNNPLENGWVGKENHNGEKPPEKQQENLCEALGKLVEAVEEEIKTYEETLRESKITFNKFTTPTQHRAPEEYMAKWLIPMVAAGKVLLYCGFTADSLKQMIKVEGAEMAKKKYQATVWAKNTFEPQDMPTTPELALEAFIKYHDSRKEKKPSGVVDEVEFIPTIPDDPSKEQLKTISCYKSMVIAAKRGSNIAVREALVEMFAGKAPAVMTLEETIEKIWTKCQDALASAARVNATIKTEATTTPEKALSLARMIHANFTPRSVKEIKGVSLSELVVSPSTATNALVGVRLASEDKRDGMDDAEAGDNDEARDNDPDMVLSSAVPPVGSPSEAPGRADDAVDPLGKRPTAALDNTPTRRSTRAKY